MSSTGSRGCSTSTTSIRSATPRRLRSQSSTAFSVQRRLSEAVIWKVSERMPDRERIERGLRFEGRVREILGGRLLPGSGNQWHSQGDVRGQLIASCKGESYKSWNKVRQQLSEAIDISFGTGAIPILALLDDDEEELVVIRLGDLARALSGEVVIAPADPGREEKVRARIDTPSILR